VGETVQVSAPVTGTDKVLAFEAGKLAPQADGAVVGRLGDTVVLVTATAARSVREGTDFFPLTVDIEERMYAAGKIPGSFFRREGRASDQAILTCRLIDRPIRPCFPKGFRNEVHVVGTILGADLVNPHDVLAINTASAALMISGIPFDGPIGAVRMAWSTEGRWIPHSTYQEGDASCFELVVAGRAVADDDDAEIAIMMVEAGGTEGSFERYAAGAPKVTEEVIAEGLELSKTWIRESIALQRELVERFGKREPLEYELYVEYGDDVLELVEQVGIDELARANAITDKLERKRALEAATGAILERVGPEFAEREHEVRAAAQALTKRLVRRRIVEEGVRIDGRKPEEIRPVSCEVGLIPTAHGSGLFERGDTQVLNVATLGMPRMNQLLDTIGIDESKRYMHHYNMPPFATGETGFIRGPKRREIGHGLLAERALLPVIPSESEFPYTMRLVSEVLSSNGSTSMASVCGSSLSLMDAGVPIKAPVAGIAMGLVAEEGRYVTLTDILGAEDAFGDMDFKVAGTRDAVTALQLDTKLEGLPADVLARALAQARQARLEILDVMQRTIPAPRPQVSANAPKIVSFEIPADRIGEVIGPKGKVINALQAETGADITIEDGGLVGVVTIGAKDPAAVEEAKRRIFLIVEPPEAKVGAVYQGRIVNITKFGAFVNILPGRDGLPHISKLGGGRRVERVEDVLSLGQEVEVRVEEIDAQGKVSLSLVGSEPEVAGRAGRAEDGAVSHGAHGSAGDRGLPRAASSPGGAKVVPLAAFEEALDAELEAELGELGPAPEELAGVESGGGGRRRRRRRRR
jgi:polyribonucleotide nucleotidyltransferase